MNDKKRILVVDDDEDLRMIIKESLESDTFVVKEAENGNFALKVLENEKFDLMITDLMMPGIKGNELLSRAKTVDPDIGVLLMSAYGTVETAVDAMKEGAFDFITKPFSISHIESRINRFFEFSSLKTENTKLKKLLARQKTRNKLIGESKAATELKYNIDIVSRSNATVFLKGESGTGKEVVAETIHMQSDRSDKPFLKINCAAVPETLFESTLFGHMKGAFSGAHKDQKGIFEECDGGTLLLDEISEIPQTMQAKLLRVIQEMCLVRVGSTSEIAVDVRIIATTNKNVSELVKNGKFREDLFFRLNVFPIEVPTLNERKTDIPILVNYFLDVFKGKYNYDKKTISSEAMEKLNTYNWPGNIRQLFHLLERAILFSGKKDEIDIKHLKFESDLETNNLQEVKKFDVMPLAEMEKQLIFAALNKTNNHRTQAADLLGITVRTLRNKLHIFEENGENKKNDLD